MRSTQSVTGSWRRHGNNGRFVASKPLDVETATLQPVFGAVRFKLVEGSEGLKFQIAEPPAITPLTRASESGKLVARRGRR